MTRFSKTDWLDLGLKVLSKEGALAIRIEHLCKLAKRTKGSFYHHFKSRDVFVADLLAHWGDRFTQSVIDQVETQASPVEKLKSLNAITAAMDMGVGRELRRWAGADTQVARAIEAVDNRRIEYVASLLKQAKNISSQHAIDLAVMNYATMIGYQQMYTPINLERRTRIELLYVEILQGLPDY
ncbi:MAG: hypothetical protein COA43_12120 [Robiginitomaculum sp.]|nr:MAG: hypothetical protein COA43_12120 [Robiginitomaculum sp.]